ncbi:MAG TPA: hypothetical protein VK544_05205 [Gemmatimonadaceae bacterium]|nr:hypothetical protein [Gemmatimonadaceae bacterium]
MTEDNFEEFLKKAAKSYNAPPARTPRDDMWNAIQAERAAGPRVVYGGGSPVRESSARRFSPKIWLGAAAAAVLLLATGVGVGRWSASSTTTRSVADVNPPTAGSLPDSTGGTRSIVPPNSSGVVAVTPPGDGGTGAASPGAPSGSGRNPQTGLRNGGAPQVATDGNRTAGPNRDYSNNSSSASAYQLTAVRHLSEAEALLTSFRTRSATDQQMDAQLGKWARDLLSNTRLLLDSPVANDPQRRPLLEDLELVLVQIVQLSPGSTPQDREMIEKTLQHDHVMTRLRTAIPAGSQRGS